MDNVLSTADYLVKSQYDTQRIKEDSVNSSLTNFQWQASSDTSRATFSNLLRSVNIKDFKIAKKPEFSKI